MPQDKISIRGARAHNLKNIDVTIPRDKLVVITGLSGSGKSSLAFNTIFAEGQRRYVESLSTYARQFLERMEKPDVDSIDGLSPALAIGQKGTTQNPRSTVGTVTEIYDYLRLLYARIGHPHCPKCGREISQQTVQQMVDAVLKLPEGSRIMLLAPLVNEHQGAYEPLFDEMLRSGYVRVRQTVDPEQMADTSAMGTKASLAERVSTPQSLRFVGGEEIESSVSARICPDCHGTRLKPEALSVTVGERNIAQVTQLSIEQA